MKNSKRFNEEFSGLSELPLHSLKSQALGERITSNGA